MTKVRVQPLARFFALGVTSAAAALVFRARAEALLAPYLKGQTIIPQDVAAYTGVFILSFVVLSFLSRRVSISVSLKARGLETATGVAPVLARMVLGAGVFVLPLLFLHAQGGRHSAPLQSLITAADHKAATVADQGYNSQDRGLLKEMAQADKKD